MSTLEEQNNTLRKIIGEIWWMAQRYANGRSTYAPSMYNQMIDLAIKNGVKLEADEIYAEDGDFGKWIPERQCFEKERIR
jgi:hypothetical protein